MCYTTQLVNVLSGTSPKHTWCHTMISLFGWSNKAPIHLPSVYYTFAIYAYIYVQICITLISPPAL